MKFNKSKTRRFINSLVKSPAHYVEGRKYEPLKVIADWKLGFNLGSALKYIARYKRKDLENPEIDLQKAQFFLQEEINQEEKRKS